jgi:hypothetical protein
MNQNILRFKDKNKIDKFETKQRAQYRRMKNTEEDIPDVDFDDEVEDDVLRDAIALINR